MQRPSTGKRGRKREGELAPRYTRAEPFGIMLKRYRPGERREPISNGCKERGGNEAACGPALSTTRAKTQLKGVPREEKRGKRGTRTLGEGVSQKSRGGQGRGKTIGDDRKGI